MFTVPKMLLIAGVYDNYGPPYTPRPPARLNTPCQLRLNKPGFSSSIAGPSPLGILFITPAKTDVRPLLGFSFGPPDVVEVPLNSGRFYTIQSVEDVARGFPNEYRLALLVQVFSQGPPIP